MDGIFSALMAAYDARAQPPQVLQSVARSSAFLPFDSLRHQQIHPLSSTALAKYWTLVMLRYRTYFIPHWQMIWKIVTEPAQVNIDELDLSRDVSQVNTR